MQAMNQYINNRGFGGPPQPQRQGGRRGMNRGGGGGYRNSRFDQHQANTSPNPGGQRPDNEPPKQAPQQEKQPQQTPAPPVQKEKDMPPPQAKTPQTPLQQTQPQQQQNPAPKNQEPKDIVDKAAPNEQKNQNKTDQQQNNQSNFQKNVNGNFGGPIKQGGTWSQGNNRQSGNFGGPRGQFGPKGGQNMGQGGQGGPGGHGGPVMGDLVVMMAHMGVRGKIAINKGIITVVDHMMEQMLAHKLKDLMGPLNELPSIEQPEVKFNGRSRLYIGNLTSDITEEEVLGMFNQFGETAELFINKEKNFGFIKMDYRVNAEKAKRELDGKVRNGRSLRVRFAPHNSAIRIKNLPPFVSNELLYKAFEIFGKIERAYVRVDERGKTLGEGIVEYARKPSALAAIRNCGEKCFFLTSSLRPVIVESLEEPDEFDGFPEKNIIKKNQDFYKAREVGPRFAEPGSFEHEYGTRWKQLHELHRQKEDALKKELAAEEEKLEAQMEYAKYEHETELLREQLRQREQDRERQKRSWEMAERAADERRESERLQLLRHEEELALRMRNQDDELRRRQQENTLFVQAQRLNSMLDRQEQGMFDHQQPMDGAGFREQFDMPRGGGGYDDMPQNRAWEGRQMDDYPNKRRRF
ncbi:unnamed protein product [Leptidea sinapis]|uniref:RRM domain-containing protein n=1 Tax=Leptidea sinapis TaxID=189913 RepID=A0A5E4PXP9_9NEOP|nr:unnamed protein product [Leptidea sinapis]